jgi:hypothetical protein
VHGVELVEAGGERFEIIGQRMHLAPGGGVPDHAREVRELQDQQALFESEIFLGGNLPHFFRAHPGPLKDARYAGVGVLHVEDRVLVGLADGKVEVEVHLRLVRGAHVEVARHIRPDLVQELVEGYEA